MGAVTPENPATVVDVEARWRPLTDPERSVAESLLDDAWAIILARSPGVTDRLTGGTLEPRLVVATVSAMVLRVLRNPDGKRTESIDDYAWTRDNAVSAGLLYVAPDELALLLPPRAARTSSVRLIAYGDR